MNFLDTPFIVEFFFVLSTLVFLATLYAILPALIYNKPTLSKLSMIHKLWYKLLRAWSVSVSKKKRWKEFCQTAIVILKDKNLVINKDYTTTNH